MEIYGEKGLLGFQGQRDDACSHGGRGGGPSVVVGTPLPQVCSDLEDRGEILELLGQCESHASRKKFTHRSGMEGC